MKTPPEDRIPSDQDLLQLLQHTGGLTLRQMCRTLWPDLPWEPRSEEDNALRRIRRWPTLVGSWPGTAAAYLLRRMHLLILAGQVQPLPQEGDLGDAVVYTLPLPPPLVVEREDGYTVELDG